VIAEEDCARRFTLEVPKDLRGLAIKAVAEDHVGRDRLRPPIAFDSTFVVHVAHDG
jgi:hypothetical protein